MHESVICILGCNRDVSNAGSAHSKLGSVQHPLIQRDGVGAEQRKEAESRSSGLSAWEFLSIFIFAFWMGAFKNLGVGVKCSIIAEKTQTMWKGSSHHALRSSQRCTFRWVA
ncbi:uncharacterized protein LOC128853014 [Cuculus canorus]|uniref:uncharacterized protein LOC128853014 n=1 Tax=Cuculus canorus TaxID=55661 RepID=UPI0023AB2682|nr:uncharacterized protein LOC128853014 [Cuculus canorus]